MANQPNPVQRLGIAGSGSIACGLARLAGEKHEVVLWARSADSATRAEAAVDGAARVVTELGELGECDVVVEAIAEDSEAKSALLGRLGAELPEAELLATTTSSLSVTELARASGRADRFAGLHVFNPVEKMKLVELAFPPEATLETRERFHALCEWFGKHSVEVPDIPGFVVNRLLFPYLFAAVRLLDQTDLEPQAVDDCMRHGAGHPMGPLKLLDLVGLDVAVAIGDAIGAEAPERMQALIAEGKLGRKSGAGFYTYGD